MSNTTTAKETESKVESIIPILYVKNLAASIAYYVNVLGFKMDWDWGDPPAFGSVSRDDFSIMLSEGWGGHPGTWIWIGVEDAEAFYDEYKASGATIRETPTNYPWAYELRVEDLDGHVLRIASASKADEPYSD